MALITCPDCGGKVSDKANVCIHCGRPLSEEKDYVFSNKTIEEMYSEHFVKESYDKDGWIPFLW